MPEVFVPPIQHLGYVERAACLKAIGVCPDDVRMTGLVEESAGIELVVIQILVRFAMQIVGPALSNVQNLRTRIAPVLRVKVIRDHLNFLDGGEIQGS